MKLDRPPQPRRRGKARAKGVAPSPSKDTRQHLLEVAGQIFAERGFSAATGKEICHAAGANVAAINYHFGGIEPLYQAVLHEVVGRMISIDTLKAAIAATTDPRERLRGVLGVFVAAMTGPLASSWELRVLAREIISPATSPTLLEKEIEQRVKIIKGIVAEAMDVPADDPAVAIGYLSVMAPCIMLLIADRSRFSRLFPALQFEPSSQAMITDGLVRSGYGGLRELAERVPRKAAKTTAKAR